MSIAVSVHKHVVDLIGDGNFAVVLLKDEKLTIRNKRFGNMLNLNVIVTEEAPPTPFQIYISPEALPKIVPNATINFDAEGNADDVGAPPAPAQNNENSKKTPAFGEHSSKSFASKNPS